MNDMLNSSWHIIKQLNHIDSFELFIFHAFKETKPPSEASNLKILTSVRFATMDRTM